MEISDGQFGIYPGYGYGAIPWTIYIYIMFSAIKCHKGFDYEDEGCRDRMTDV